MGYFTPPAYDDLHNLKYIRNLFAHYTEHNSFNTQKITDRCANFKMIQSRVRQSTSQVVRRKEGKIILDTLALADKKIFLNLAKPKEALATSRDRFVTTAKLFVAAFECHQNEDRHYRLPKPIL